MDILAIKNLVPSLDHQSILNLHTINYVNLKLLPRLPHQTGVLFTGECTTLYRVAHILAAITEIIYRPYVREFYHIQVRVAPAFRIRVGCHQ